MRLFSGLFILLLPFFSCQAAEDSLTTAITHYFQSKYRESGTPVPEISVTIKTPATQWPNCAYPDLSLPGNGRLMGNVSIAATCDKLRRYLQVEVQVVTEYLVAARPIARGATLTSADIKKQRGRIDKLPVQLLRDPADADNAVALRDINPDQPLTGMMIRPRWLVHAGQTVMVTAIGEGFRVASEGQVLNNASANQTVRVRISNGQVVNARIDSSGDVTISL